MSALWKVSKLVIDGYRAIELNEYQDADKKERLCEWALIGRYGELYGYSSAGIALPFRGRFVWAPAAIAKVKKAIVRGQRGTYYCGKELMAQLQPSQVAPVSALLGLDHGLAPETLAEMMNNIKGRFSEVPARIDDLVREQTSGRTT